jgi:SEC-C motif-containing protein
VTHDRKPLPGALGNTRNSRYAKGEKKYRGPCPCGSRQSYERCCERLHGGEQPANAETLMRSRYTAYALKLEHYLLESWHPATRPPALDLDVVPRRWLGLKIVRHEKSADGAATVEFFARYKQSGRVHEMHETSLFSYEGGRWLYVKGDETA